MGWSAIRSEAENVGVDGAGRANLMDFIAKAGELKPPQSITVNPYNGGVSLHWLSRGLEIVVFGNRYESYRFCDKETDIKHWPHVPGEQIDAALLAEIGRD